MIELRKLLDRYPTSELNSFWLKNPEIVDGRRERIWTSGRDLADLVTIGLTRPDLGYVVVNGVSRCADALLGFGTAEPLGYDPKDCSDGHRAIAFKPREDLTDRDGASFVGGFFAVNELPSPLRSR